MMVTFVSQCEKNALKKTRRVLDAFANRIGDNTWQTIITQEGLDTVKRMLRQSATRSTAVSCHWIRSRSRSQLLWVVGNKRKFNSEGVVAVNYTERNIEQYNDNFKWNTLPIIKNAVGIAGLFHDFGKANALFQNKLNPNKKTKNWEPYRHDWVSLRLFETFVKDAKTDTEWLDKLTSVDSSYTLDCICDGLEEVKGKECNPLIGLPHFAKLIGWLILSHHKLPIYPNWKSEGGKPKLKCIDEWFDINFSAQWNSFNCKDDKQKEYLSKNWQFNQSIDGTNISTLPFQSDTWCKHARKFALESKLLLTGYSEKDWLIEDVFSSHIARLCLMLADHHYSSKDTEGLKKEYRALNYLVFANTDQKTKQIKQQLDEHLIAVADCGQKIASALPILNRDLKHLEDNTALSSKSKHKNFAWQDSAKKMAEGIGTNTSKNGFFGVNMASTGKGKTRANAKIMYALGKNTGKRRFTVALGLRTLTLQTGEEFRVELDLKEDQLAVAVGGVATKLLFEKKRENSQESDGSDFGSESQEDYLDREVEIKYQGTAHQHSLTEYLAHDAKDKRMEKLIQAPVLVCTIDHLIPATEGTKSGRQIAPMLRLLTSDLILDEPDDFGLEDLPALCRLVHWAGMLGSRVLLSTATMPPALTYALFNAYQSGWSSFAKANIDSWNGDIQCAWFDENSTYSAIANELDVFRKNHDKFIKKRIKFLKENIKPKQRARIATIEEGGSVEERFAHTISKNIHNLHNEHSQEVDNKQVSTGIVRMANINTMVAVAKELLKQEPNKDTYIHWCIYHSRYPFAIRSFLEEKLDAQLKRKRNPISDSLNELKENLRVSNAKNHIFVVLASPVAEVGRDHDYDWAIVEPSSMRSIIQLAGRVLRHRDEIPKTENIVLLDKNIKALKNEKVCFNRPGFESENISLKYHSLTEEILIKEQFEIINAVPRITQPEDLKTSKGEKLVSLEHFALYDKLLINEQNEKASVWWESTPHWCGEVQNQQRFRKSKKEETYILNVNNDGETIWEWKNENVKPPKYTTELSSSGADIQQIMNLEIASNNGFWFDLSAKPIYEQISIDFHLSMEKVGRKFGELKLVEYENKSEQEYSYHPNLGVYEES